MDWQKWSTIEWSPQSLDLIPLDFFLWGHLKSVVYTPPSDINDLNRQITTTCKSFPYEVFQNVRGSGTNRLKEFFHNIILKTSATVRWEHPLTSESKLKAEITIKIKGNQHEIIEAAKMILKELSPNGDSFIRVKMDVCRLDHGVLVGKRGNKVQRLQSMTNCHVNFSYSSFRILGMNSNEVFLEGEQTNVRAAGNLIRNEQLIRFSFQFHPKCLENKDITEHNLRQLTQCFKFYIDISIIRQDLWLLTICGPKWNYRSMQRGYDLLKKKIFKKNIPIRGFLLTELGYFHQNYLVSSVKNILSSIMKASNTKIVIPSERRTLIKDISLYIPSDVLKKLKMTTLLILGDLDNVSSAYDQLMKHLPVTITFEVKHLVTEAQIKQAVSGMKDTSVEITQTRWKNVYQVCLFDEEQRFEELLLVRKKILDAVYALKTDDNAWFENYSSDSSSSSSGSSNMQPKQASRDVQYTLQSVCYATSTHESWVSYTENHNYRNLPLLDDETGSSVDQFGFPLVMSSKLPPITSIMNRDQRILETFSTVSAESTNIQGSHENFHSIYANRTRINGNHAPSAMLVQRTNGIHCNRYYSSAVPFENNNLHGSQELPSAIYAGNFPNHGSQESSVIQANSSSIHSNPELPFTVLVNNHENSTIFANGISFYENRGSSSRIYYVNANIPNNQEFSSTSNTRIASTNGSQDSMLVVPKVIALSGQGPISTGPMIQNTPCGFQTEAVYANSYHNEFGAIGTPNSSNSLPLISGGNFYPEYTLCTSQEPVTGAQPMPRFISSFGSNSTEVNDDNNIWTPVPDTLSHSQVVQPKIDYPRVHCPEDDQFSYWNQPTTNVQNFDVPSYCEEGHSSAPKQEERTFRENLYAPFVNTDSLEAQGMFMETEKFKAGSNLSTQYSLTRQCKNSSSSYGANDSESSYMPITSESSSLSDSQSSSSKDQSSHEAAEYDSPPLKCLSKILEYKRERIVAHQTMWEDICGETRVPDDKWAGCAFSRSMPESYLKNQLANRNKISTIGEEKRSGFIEELLQKSVPNLNSAAQISEGVPVTESESPYSKSNLFEAVPLMQMAMVESAVTDYQNLRDLLIKSDLGEYYNVFEYIKVDLENFLTLTEDDLKKLNLNYSTRMRILAVITAARRQIERNWP